MSTDNTYIYTIKKSILGGVVFLLTVFGITYAADIISTTETITSGSTIGAGWFQDVNNKLNTDSSGTVKGFCKSDHLPFRSFGVSRIAIEPAYLISDPHGGQDCVCRTGRTFQITGLNYHYSEWDARMGVCVKN